MGNRREQACALLALLGVVALTLGTVHLTTRGVHLLVPEGATAAVHPPLLLFALGSLFGFGYRRAGIRPALPGLHAGFVISFGAVAATSGAPPETYGSSLAGIIVEAGVEEVVFRLLLPAAALGILAGKRQLSRRTMAVLAVCASQFTFALAHSAAGSAAGAGEALAWHPALRLAVAGLLFHLVWPVFGLGTAIGLHAALNVLLLNGTALRAEPWTAPALLLVGLGGLGYVWADGRHVCRVHRLGPAGRHSPFSGADAGGGGRWSDTGRWIRASAATVALFGLGPVSGVELPFFVPAAIVLGQLALHHTPSLSSRKT